MKAAAVALLLVAAAKFPAFTAPVVDEAHVVPDAVEQQVDNALNDYQQRTGNQIAVAVVKTTGDKSLEDYSIDLAREWGVGQKGKDNGVLLLIAYDDRKVRIEVGRGLEPELTDLESGRIIREQIVPRMQAGDVGGAVIFGTEAIRSALGDPAIGQPAPPAAPVAQPEPQSRGIDAVAFLLPLLFLFGFGLVGRRRRRRGGWFGFPIFFPGGGWGGGGGFGGGGFGGGGGGDFGGGGASGGW